MNVPTRSWWGRGPTRLNVTRPLVTLDVSPDELLFTAASPLGWFIHPRRVARVDVLGVHLNTERLSSSVWLSVSESSPYTFWTSSPHDVLRALSECGYPVTAR
jgi:hypothetical protein